jgi:hypothetical protein
LFLLFAGDTDVDFSDLLTFSSIESSSDFRISLSEYDELGIFDFLSGDAFLLFLLGETDIPIGLLGLAEALVGSDPSEEDVIAFLFFLLGDTAIDFLEELIVGPVAVCR